MKNYRYLFAHLFNKEADCDNPNDPVVREIEDIAKKNKLSVVFNKMGEYEGGAAVMPPPNQVTVTLSQGADNKWRIFAAG